MKTISFARGVPSADLLPGPEISAAAQRALARDAAGALAYGAAEGYRPLRDWFAQRYDVPVERVLVTNGSLQGVALLIEHLFAGKGGLAVVEAPTYDRTILLFKRFGATVEALALGADGIDVDALEQLCRSGRKPRVVYVIPNFQNPAGVTTSRAKRERLVRSRPSTTSCCSRTTRTTTSASRADEPTMLSMDRSLHVIHMTSDDEDRRARRPRRRGDPAAGACRADPPARERHVHRARPPRPGDRRRVLRRRRVRAGPRRACARGLRSGATRWSRRSIGRSASASSYVTPPGGYFLWISCPASTRIALAAEAEQAGVPVVRGRRATRTAAARTSSGSRSRR
jgi:hypothetical protein